MGMFGKVYNAVKVRSPSAIIQTISRPRGGDENEEHAMRRLLMILGILLIAVPAKAWDCDMYAACCWQYIDAVEEAGSPPDVIQSVDMMCGLQDALPPGPARTNFCADVWMRVSPIIWEQYMDGIIGFYPEPCMAGMDEDPDIVEEPNPDYPDPSLEPGMGLPEELPYRE